MAMGSPEVVTLPSYIGGKLLRVELRWEIKQRDIEALWDLHDASFAVKYSVEYYNWLLSESCIALVAYVTPSCIASVVRGMDANENNKEGGHSLECHNDRVDEEDDYACDVDGATTGSGEIPSEYTVPVGFCIGQIAYKQRRDGRLVASPTGYLGSFAVDARLQQRGLGELLLQRFLSYMFFSVPISPHFFLNYNSSPVGTRRNRSTTTTTTSWWSYFGLNIFTYLFSRWFGNKEEETLDHGGASDVGRDKYADAPFVPQDGNGGDRRGVDEVWLHCLANNTKLVRYYLKRGFISVLVKPDFYSFDGLFHDGMLLVCCRDTLCSEADAARKSASAVDDDCPSTPSLLSELARTTCITANSEEIDDVVGLFDAKGGSDTDIVDVELEIDSARTQKNWYSEDGGDAVCYNSSLRCVVNTPSVVNTVLVAVSGVVWLVAAGVWSWSQH